jgi:hypothetical protein
MKKMLLPAHIRRTKKALFKYFVSRKIAPSEEEWWRWLQTLETQIKDHYQQEGYLSSKHAPNFKAYCLLEKGDLDNEELDAFMQSQLTINAYWYWREHRYQLTHCFNNTAYQVTIDEQEKVKIEEDPISRCYGNEDDFND